MNAARLRTYAGLAAAIVPCAIIVHLVAEAAAVGRDGLGFGFIIRHAYFGLLVAAAAIAFGRTVGIGCAATERRRRCALLRADLRGDRGRHGLASLVAANLGFFVLTQVVEGAPVAGGAVALSLVIALAGSIGAALIVFFFGNAIARATIDSVIGRTARRQSRRVLANSFQIVAVPRHATATYSLLRPSRPPPRLSHF